MKKIFTIIVMALFLLNILSVYAERGKSENLDIQERIVKNTEKIRGISEFGKERQEKTQEFMKEFRKANSSGDKRELIQKRREQLKQDFEKAKELFKESKEQFLKDRSTIRDLKQELKKCKEQETEKCRVKILSVTVESKAFLLSTVETLITLQTQAITKVEASDFEGKVDVLARLQVDLDVLNKLKIDIEALGEKPAKEDVKRIAKELKEHWAVSKHRLTLGTGFVMSVRIAGILVKSEKLETKLNKTLEKLKEKGYDTNKADTKLVEFSTHIAEAKAQLEIAKVKYSEARIQQFSLKEPQNSTNVSYKGLQKQAHDALRNAHEHLKLAHQTLKDIVKEIKTTKEGEKVLEEETKETENEEITNEMSETTQHGTEENVVTAEINTETQVGA